jgi:beta-D-xylosidase 4
LHYTSFIAKFASQLNFRKDGNRNSTRQIAIDSFLYGCYETTLDLCPFAAESPISIEVTNTGSRRSDFVALVFVAGEYGPSSSPLKQLVGYKRLKRTEGEETRKVDVETKVGGLVRVDESGTCALAEILYTFIGC